MMNRIKVVVALLLFTLTIQAQTTAIDQAKSFVTNENYGGARKTLSQYISAEKEPLKQAEAYYWLGECDYREFIDDNKQQAFDKSKEQYNKGLAMAKNSPHCLVGMGKLLLDAKNAKEALKTFDNAIKESRKKPYKEGHPEIYMLIGDAYLNGINKNPDQAVNNYTRARDIDPKMAETWIKLGDGSMAKNDPGTAMTAYETASEKDKNNAVLYLKRSKIWKRGRKYDLAQKELEDGLKINDKYALIYKDLIELYMDTKQFNKILPTLEKYIPLAGDDYGARRRLVTFLTYQAKDYDRAAVEAEKLIKDDPTQTTMYRWMAWAKCAKADSMAIKDPKVLGDDAKMLYQQSIDASKKLFELVPVDRLMYYDYEFPAKASLKLGQLEEATKYYKKVIEIDSSKTCDIYTSLVQANYDAKKMKEALDILEEKALKCPVTSRENYLAMYYGYYGKLYERSVKFADKYIEVMPTVTDGFFFKAQSLDQLDDDTNPKFTAKESYEKVISVYEAKPDARSKPHVIVGYNYMAYFHGKQNDLVKAKEFYQKTIIVDPTNKTATDMLLQLGNR